MEKWVTSPLDPGRLPLSRFERLHTVDVDQARQVVTEAFCPHRLVALDNADRFETRFHSVSTGGVSLSYLDYGGSVHITPYEQDAFYLVLMPLAGMAELSHGREHFVYDSNGASEPPVDRRYDIHVSAGSPHLVVWVARDRLEEHLRARLDRPVTEPIRFALGMDMTAPAIRSWRRAVNLLLDDVDCGVPSQPLAMRELEGLILSRLLLAQPNNYSALLQERPRRTAPKAIRRAADLIEAHAAEPLTVEDIAQATGLSLRALQDGFRRFLDTTPTSHLREIRLRNVREQLIVADPRARPSA